MALRALRARLQEALRPARRLLHGEARLREPGPHEIAVDLVVVDDQDPR